MVSGPTVAYFWAYQTLDREGDARSFVYTCKVLFGFHFSGQVACACQKGLRAKVAIQLKPQVLVSRAPGDDRHMGCESDRLVVGSNVTLTEAGIQHQ